ncbi:Small, acid-soluble spore protein I [compost metagenome]
MNLNLRQAIIQRVHKKSNEELHEVIEDSIGGEERVLPGLGVLFEIIWQHSDPEIQNSLVSTLSDHIEK